MSGLKFINMFILQFFFIRLARVVDSKTKEKKAGLLYLKCRFYRMAQNYRHKKNIARRVKMKVFLGGTCAGPDYRTTLIPLLDKKEISYYNPVVEDWTEECIAEEERQKLFECDIHLYLITPHMKGCYSIAEVMTSCLGSWPKPKTTIFAYLKKYGGKEFDEAQVKSLNAVGKMVREGGQFFLENFDDISKLADVFAEYKKEVKNS